MEYLIKRGDAQFGPYSLGGLQQYLQSGQLSSDDLTRSEGMENWVPLSQVLGTVPVPPPMPANYGAAQQVIPEPPGGFVKLPPNMRWWRVLSLSIITNNLFMWIWSIVLGNWARKLSGKNTALVMVAMYPAAIVSFLVCLVVAVQTNNGAFAIASIPLLIAGIITYFIGVFGIRSAMEHYYNNVEKIGLSLSGVMVFFFGIFYLQYHVNKLARLKMMAAGYY